MRNLGEISQVNVRWYLEDINVNDSLDIVKIVLEMLLKRENYIYYSLFYSSWCYWSFCGTYLTFVSNYFIVVTFYYVSVLYYYIIVLMLTVLIQ